MSNIMRMISRLLSFHSLSSSVIRLLTPAEGGEMGSSRSMDIAPLEIFSEAKACLIRHWLGGMGTQKMVQQ